MDTRDIRVWTASGLFLIYLTVYGYILYDYSEAYIPDSDIMRSYLKQMRAYRELNLFLYIIGNAIMCLTAKIRFEKEILSVGIFHVLLITILSTLHNLAILVMSTQWTLIFIIGITIAFLLIILKNGRKHELFKDNG